MKTIPFTAMGVPKLWACFHMFEKMFTKKINWKLETGKYQLIS